MTAPEIGLRLTREAGKGADRRLGPCRPRPGRELSLPDFGDGVAAAITWEEGGWRLHNRSDGLCLFVNETELNPGAAVALAHGDMLEAGLRRYVVEFRAGAPAAEAPPPWEPPLPGLADGDPFDLVPGTSELGAVDAMAEGEGHGEAFGSDAGLLGQLGRDYFQALTDPEAGTVVLRGRGPARAARTEALIDDLAGLTLEECTTGVLEIDAVIERLGGEDRTAAWQEPPDDVLWLFAPKAARRALRRAPPAVTRYDHHVIGIDSVQAPGRREPDPES